MRTCRSCIPAGPVLTHRVTISVYEKAGSLSFQRRNQLFKQLLKSILTPAVNRGALSSLKGGQEEASAEDQALGEML